MGVDGLEASLDLWMGTFTGKEVASMKSVIKFLKMISEWIGRNSGPDDDSEYLLEEFGDTSMLFNDVLKEDMDDFMDDDSAGLIGFQRYSNIVTWIFLGDIIIECFLG